MPTPPDLAAVKVYLRIDADDTDRDAEIAAALATETQLQLRAIRPAALGIDPEPPAEPLPYPAWAAEALCRRVARNLALRGLPLAVLQSDAEAGPLVLPGRDPERARLEGNFRRLPTG